MKPQIVKPGPPALSPPSRMTLGSIVKGRQQDPWSILLHAPEKVGKTTFAADAPSPIFIDAERGSIRLDTSRFPTPETWQDVRDAIATLIAESHPYRTLVVDTVDWVEPLIWAHICRRDGKADVESYGYGKGYAAALDEWRIFLADVERLRRVKGMHVILLAHSWIRTFKNPEAEDFDRYELKLNPKAGGLLKDWPEALLFANTETIVAENEKTKRVRGVSTGARLIYTQRTAAYDAGNRYGLPPSLPLSWPEFEAAATLGQVATAEDLIAAISAAGERLEAKDQTKAKELLAKAENDTVKLAKLLNWTRARPSGEPNPNVTKENSDA